MTIVAIPRSRRPALAETPAGHGEAGTNRARGALALIVVAEAQL